MRSSDAPSGLLPRRAHWSAAVVRPVCLPVKFHMPYSEALRACPKDKRIYKYNSSKQNTLHARTVDLTLLARNYGHSLSRKAHILAATNALYLAAIEVGSLTGEGAVAQAVKDIKALLQKKSSSLKATTVTFHASLLGITMVDIDKKFAIFA